MIDFSKINTSRADMDTIFKIVQRAKKFGKTFDPLSLTMDLSACHHFTPLMLNELLAADDFNFSHDVFGILRHFNRETGELNDHFSPRFDQVYHTGYSYAAESDERGTRNLNDM